MNDKTNSSQTSVVCYFCNVTFENSYLLQAHIKQCGSILRQCLRCKAYVERRHYDSHNRLCSKSLNYLDRHSRDLSDSNSSNGNNNMVYATNKPNPQQNESYYKTAQNGPTNAYLVNSQPFVYTADNSLHRKADDKNVYAMPSKPNGSTLRESLLNNEHKFYNSPEYSSLDRSEHSIHVRQGYNSRPVSVVSSESEILQYMKNEFSVLRNYLNEEKNQREKLSNEVIKMRKQYLLSEERNQILLATITTLRNNIEDESEKYKVTYSLLGREIDALRSKNEELFQKVAQMDMATDNLQKEMEREQIDRSHLDLIVNAQDNKLRGLSKLETNLEMLKDVFNQEIQERKDSLNQLQKQIEQLKELISTEISKHEKQLQSVEEGQVDLKQKLKTNIEEMSKYSNLSKESKALMGIVEEDTKKIQKLEENVKTMSDSVATLQKQRYTNHLENNTAINSPEIYDKTGHLMWKIGDFEKKLKDSIANESVLLSPIFYSSKHGYALQAELYLNGLGKWKGRHITACVYVIPGLWDPLLAWPVRLTAKIVLRDQATKTLQAVHIVKTLQVRKRDHREDIKLLSKNSLPRNDDKRKSAENLSTIEKEARALEASIKKQYIFIPHSSLDKFDYIKNNVMFVEILIENT